MIDVPWEPKSPWKLEENRIIALSLGSRFNFVLRQESKRIVSLWVPTFRMQYFYPQVKKKHLMTAGRSGSGL